MCPRTNLAIKGAQPATKKFEGLKPKLCCVGGVGGCPKIRGTFLEGLIAFWVVPHASLACQHQLAPNPHSPTQIGT